MAEAMPRWVMKWHSKIVTCSRKLQFLQRLRMEASLMKKLRERSTLCSIGRAKERAFTLTSETGKVELSVSLGKLRSRCSRKGKHWAMRMRSEFLREPMWE